ncbi:ATP-binding protein [Streptomyces sp. NPDC021622]|uniref:sensor histidine kinase n=1 Tax=Streptomyces sp. NPDC021622 TaxID=3155013 RepID=UPI0033FB5D56
MPEPRRRLPRPRTVRARITMAVAAVLAVAMTAGAGVVLGVVRGDLWGIARQAAQQQAHTAVELLDQAQTGDNGASYYIDGDDVLTKEQLAKLDPAVTPEPTASPPEPAPSPTVPAPATSGPDASRAPSEAPSSLPKSVEVAEAVSGDGRYRVTAQVDFDKAEAAWRTMAALLVPGVLLIVLLGALLTWRATGRALRPVEAVRREAAEITATDLHRRLPVPAAGDEISRLATTLNATLDRLERAVTRLQTFTADVSHELRSPLTTLRTRLELALVRPEGADWPQVATEALEDTQQLQDMVSDLLLLARLDAHEPAHESHVDLLDLVRNQAQRPSNALPLTLELPSRPVMVRGDRAHLNRLLSNLVDNARRHAVTTVRVCAQLHDDTGQVSVEVADDGPGIPADDRERVFDRFTRLDEARTRHDGGTGLGLAIARAIATAHGGTLTAEAPVGPLHGARLVLRLPAAEREPARRSGGAGAR